VLPTSTAAPQKGENRPRGHSRIGGLLLPLLVLLPLQWFGLGSTPLGSARLHQVTLLAVAALILLRLRLKAYAPLCRTAAPLVLGVLYLELSWAALELYRGTLPTGAVQGLLYLGAFLAIGTCFYRAASGIEPGLVSLLRWSGPLACVSLLVAFSIAMLINGINPTNVLGRTVATADPEVFQKEIFRSSFAGFGLDPDMVRGNLRHEVFGALLLSLLVSTWAMKVGARVTAAQQGAYRAAVATGVALLALSLSRSVLIAATLWPMLALLRSARRGGLTRRQLLTAAVAVSAGGTLVLTGIGLVIWNRFTTDTTGYEARAENYGTAFQALGDHWLTGGYETGGQSTHNFVLDSTLRGGILAGFAALVVLVFAAARWARLVLLLPRRAEWLVPVTAALGLPLVRMGTSGGGLIPPVEWVALAFVFGVLAVRPSRQPRQPRIERGAAIMPPRP